MKIYKDEQELLNTDWQAKINEAVNAGDYRAAAQYEQARNDKINSAQYTGKQTTTNRYAQYLAPDTEPSAPATVVGGSSGSAGTKTSYPSFDAAAWEAKKPTYASDYADRIDALLNDIMNREAFSYDAGSDPLYQQYRSQYQREGTRAMEDTLAELASGAGGMNSYAVTAAQQANNYYGAQLADRIPELYQLAYEMYMQDYNQDVSDLALLQQQEADAYGRYQDELADWYAQLEAAYNQHRDAVADSQWQQSFNYNAQQDAIDNDYRQSVFDEEKEQNDIDNDYRQNSFEYDVWRDDVADSRYENETTYDRALELALAKAEGLTDTDLAEVIAASAPAEILPYAGTTTTVQTPKVSAYDNGSHTPDEIKKMQDYFGVDADGLWGKESSEAVGGLTADQAWERYQTELALDGADSMTINDLSSTARTLLNAIRRSYPYSGKGDLPASAFDLMLKSEVSDTELAYIIKALGYDPREYLLK